MATKNHFDVIYENNKLLNSDLADVTGEIYFNVSSAAAENAMKESEYLAATGGTRHDVYEDTARKELAGQVSDANKQAYNQYDLSKPTYGLSGRNLYGTGTQNSGYARYAARVNEDALKSNLSTIEQIKVAAQNEIAYSTEALKQQNQQAYAEYLSKYGTILDDYNRYFDKDEYTDAQIIEKLKKDGYTDDQIAAIPQLKTEREYEEKVNEENYTFDRDSLISDLGAGNVSPEFASIKLLENYGIGDAAKMAEDINAGRISQEAGEAWVDTVINAYTEGGARVPYTYIDAWEENGLLTPEEALDYKHTVNKERADAAVTAFDSAENVDQFLSLFGEGYDAPDSVKYSRALELLVSLDKTGVLASNGVKYTEVLNKAAENYTKAILEADVQNASMMLEYANDLYEKAKENNYPHLAELKEAVGQMHVNDGLTSIQKEFNIDAKNGIVALGNWASAVIDEDEKAGSADFKEAQESAIKKFIEDKGISVEILKTVGQRGLIAEKIVINYDGKRLEVNSRSLTSESIDALNEFGAVYDSKITYTASIDGKDTYDRTNRKTGVSEKTKTRSAGEEWK